MGTKPRRNMLGLHPDTWAGLSPNGIGRQKPHHLREMLQVANINRSNPAYAWKVLSRGVCDGCALGVAGFHDWTLDGIHLCTTRLRMLEVNTAGFFDPAIMVDVSRFAGQSMQQLRALGRIGYPLLRRRGEAGFVPVAWSEALEIVGQAHRDAGPDRTAWYLTSRGLTNETYYTAAKAARALGISNIDSAARVCHAPSSVGLKATIGVAASTCSLQDVLETDLIVLWGTNPANNQPVFMKYLDKAIKAGAKVVVINPYLEPGLKEYWVPSNPESYLFGTQFDPLHVPVRPEGDISFAKAVLKHLIARGSVDTAFIEAHTEGWSELCSNLSAESIEELTAAAGVTAEKLNEFVELYEASKGAVFIWSMGITQNSHGADGVRSIVNLALARGNVGRDGAGLMPIRGHSGVQGGGEMGAYATAFPGQLPINAETAASLEGQWGFPVPATEGLTVNEMIDQCAGGMIDVLYSSGGNFLDVLPNPDYVSAALGRPKLRIHADIVLTPQMFVEADAVLILPVRTRYEQEGGGTSTTTERRIAFSPEIPRFVQQARSEWRLYGDIAAAVNPTLAGAFSWPDNQALREEIARVVPMYAGIEKLATTGDAVQWGGRHLCADGNFPTPTGRGRFSTVDTPRQAELTADEFLLSTRRGKQFNSMIWQQEDPLTGAHRDAVYIDAGDAAQMGIKEGDAVRLSNDIGEMRGRAKLVSLARKSVQVHWPEGNAVLADAPTEREPGSKMPDYNSVVRLERLAQ